MLESIYHMIKLLLNRTFGVNASGCRQRFKGGHYLPLLRMESTSGLSILLTHRRDVIW